MAQLKGTLRKVLQLKTKQKQNSEYVDDAKALLGSASVCTDQGLCLNVHAGDEALGPYGTGSQAWDLYVSWALEQLLPQRKGRL